METKDQKLIAEAYNKVLEAAVTPRDGHKNYDTPDVFSSLREYYCYSIILTKDKNVFDINDSWVIIANSLEEAQKKAYDDTIKYSAVPAEMSKKLPIKNNKIAIVTTAGYKPPRVAPEDYQRATVVTTEHVEIKEMRDLIEKYFRMDKYNIDQDVKDKWERAITNL
jgi:hypothetical protein